MVFAEIAKGKTVQVPLVGRITKRTEIGVVRCNDQNAATGFQQSVELLHCPNHIGDVFDDVNRSNFAERRISKRKREMIEVGDDIGVRVGISIKPNCAWMLLDAAPHVEYTAVCFIRL